MSRLFLLFLLIPVFSWAQEPISSQDTTVLKQQLVKVIDAEEKRLALRGLIDFFGASDQARALTYLEQLRSLVVDENLPYWQGYISEHDAMYLRKAGLIDSAIVIYAQAREAYHAADSIEKAFLMECSIGSSYAMKGDYQAAADCYKALNSKVRNTPHLKAEAYLESQWAILYHYQGQVDSADHYYNLAISIYETLKDTSQMIRNKYNQGVLYRNSKSGKEVFEKFESLADLSRQIGDKQRLLYVLGTLSTLVQGYQMASDKRFDYALEGYLLSQDLGDVNQEIDFLVNLSKLALENENFSLSEEYLSKAEAKLSTQLSGVHLLVLDARAVFLVKQGQYDEALAIYNQYLVVADSIGKKDEGGTLMEIGNVYFFQGKYDEALQVLKRSRRMVRETGNDLLLGKVDIVLADTYLQKKAYKKGEEIAEEAVGIFTFLQDKRLLSDAYGVLVEAYRKQGKYEQALLIQDDFLLLNDSLKNIDRIRELTKKQQNFEFELEKEQLVLEQTKEELLLKAEAKNSRTIALAVAGLALLLGGFFIQSRRRNNIIRSQNKQLDQLNNTKDQLFAIIGHDLRKPALAFRGIAKKVNFLLKKKDYQRLDALGDSIEKDALSLNQLTDNLLNWALLQRDVLNISPSSQSLLDTTTEVCTLFHSLAKDKSIDLVIDIPEEVRVLADRFSLQTIIRNLVDNAIKFSPEGEQVTVTTQTAADGRLMLRIQDNGVGMSPQQLEELFSLQKDKSKEGTAGEKGTGLGLYLAYQLAERNAANLEVSSILNEGTRFTLSIPKAA